MAFDFGQYPTDPTMQHDYVMPINANGITAPGGVPYEQSGITGAPPIDPSQLQTTATTAFNSPNAQPAAPAPSAGPITMQQFNQAWLSSPYPGTVDGLKQFMAAHPEYAAAGITLGGSKGDKVYGPNNTYWGDAVVGAGAGGLGKSGLSGDTGGGVNGSAGGTLGSLGYSFGSSMAPFTGQFAAPTEQEAINTPGVQFGLNEANRMMQNSAAAKGTLLNGRFQQALAASNIGNAMQDYGNIYNRALTTFGTNYGIFKDNQDRPFDKNVTLAKLGQPQ